MKLKGNVEVIEDVSRQNAEQRSAKQLVEEEIFLNTADVMRIFHISRSTLKRWFSDPSVPCSLSPTGRKMWSSDMIMDWAMKKKNSRKVRATMESI